MYRTARATVMVVLFGAVALYYYDASLWKPLFFGFLCPPILASLITLAAGWGLAWGFRSFLRGREKKPARPGLEEVWIILAVAAVSAHALARIPFFFNIDNIGFPPGLGLLICLLQGAATFVLAVWADRKNRPLICACATLGIMSFTTLYHVMVNKPYVGDGVVGTPSWLVSAFGILCLLVCLDLPRGTLARLFSRTAGWSTGLFLLLGVVSSLLALDKELSFQLLSHTGAGAAMMLAVAAACAQRGEAKPFFRILGLGGIFVVSTGVLALLFSLPHVPATHFLDSQLRVFHAHPNIISVFLFVASCVLLVLGLVSRHKGARILSFLCAVLCVAGLAATHSRAGILAFCLALGIFFPLLLLAPRCAPWLRKTLYITLPTGAALLFVGCLFSSVAVERLSGTLRVDTIDFRGAIWSAALSTVEEHPVFGVGLGNYFSHSRFLEGRQHKLPVNTHAHSLSLHIAEGMGVPALILLGGLIFLFLKQAFQKALDPACCRDRRIYLLMAGAMLLGLQAANIFDQVPETAVPAPFWFLWGIIAGLSLDPGTAPPVKGAAGKGVAGKGQGRAFLSWMLAPLVLILAALPALGDHLTLKCAAQTSADYKDRARCLEQIMLLKPLNTQVPFHLAYLLYQNGEVKRALEVTRGIEEANQYNALFWDLRGQLLFKAKRLDEAAAAFDRALELDTSSANTPQIICNAAAVCLAQGKKGEGEELFLRLFSTYPEETVNRLRMSPDLVESLARAMDVAGNSKDRHLKLCRAFLDEAFGALHETPQDRTLDTGRFISAAMAYHAIGETDKAISLVQRSLEPFPEGFPRLQVLLGWLYLEAGQYEDAVTVLTKIENDPRFGYRASFTLVAAFFELSRVEDGIARLKKSMNQVYDIHFKKADIKTHYQWLAKGLYRAEKMDEAIHNAWHCIFFSDPGRIEPEVLNILTGALSQEEKYPEMMDLIILQARAIARSLAQKPFRSMQQAEALEELAVLAASLAVPGKKGGRPPLSPAQVEEGAAALPDSLVRALFLAFFYHRLGMGEEAAGHLERVQGRFSEVPLFQAARARIRRGF